MRIRDPIAEQEEPFNLVPLTDMVFNLLIFFMCATTFAQVEKELSVQLPHTGPVAALSAPPRQLIINIKQDGSLVVGGRTYDLDGLRGLLGTATKSDPATGVAIYADERSIMKYFAGVAGACKQSGIGETRIYYIQDDSRSGAQ